MEQKLKLKYKLHLLFILPFLLTSCGSKNEQQFFAFDTVFLMTWRGKSGFYTSTRDLLYKLSDECDATRKIPDVHGVYEINHSDEPVPVSMNLYYLLNWSDIYFELTDGVFNHLLKDVSDAYKESIEKKELPNEAYVVNLLQKAQDSYMTYGGNYSAKILGYGKLDLGAIAKGYALSLLAPLIERYSITDYIVNAGSSSILLGTNSENNGYYKVAIDHTNDYIELKNCAIGTSSIFEQPYLEKDGKIFSHIVNGQTGSAEAKHDSVIVISDDPILSDVFSTVGMVSDIAILENYESYLPLKFLVYKNGLIEYKNSEIDVKKIT